MNLVKMRTGRDCFSCCVATILGMHYEDVPQFFDYQSADPLPGWDQFDHWLAARGMWPHLERIYNTVPLEQHDFKGAHILLGMAVGRIDADESHAVVCLGGRQFDPREGGKGVRYFETGYMTAVIICHGDVNA